MTLSILDQMLQEELLLPIDKILSDWIVRDGDVEAAACIAFLSASVRDGHLCITERLPDPEAIFPGFPQIAPLIRSGFKKVPSHPAIVKDNHKLYFTRYFEEEAFIYQEIERISKAPLKQPIDDQFVKERLSSLSLELEQRAAIEMACSHPFSLITGGPGTGKTTTASCLIRLLLENNPDLKLAFAAPTGKAASHLERSLGLNGVKGATLHSLLGKRQEVLPFDFVLVDESSMIDVGMMARLVRSIKTGARLVLLGDPDQLPPVGAGSPFSDLVQKGSYETRLKKCLRAELASIVDFAKCLKQGDWEGVKKSSIPVKELKSPEEVVKSTASFLNQGNTALLSPMRKGPFGVDALNRLFLNHYISKWDKKEPFKAPIMITANHKGLDLANGEVGVLFRQNGLLETKGDYAEILGRKIPAALLPSFEYAWCVSVHKSQGSEFERVILLVPEGSDAFGRKVLYTGATRAKRSLEVWGSPDVLKATLAKEGARVSGYSS